MRLYLARYTLANGTRGVLHVVGRHSFDAVGVVLDTLGLQVRSVSVRCS